MAAADRLSLGTTEQIYLLLRVALAKHLTSGESCPLLLDDVTVQGGRDAHPRILDLLRLSADRQGVAPRPGADRHGLGG